VRAIVSILIYLCVVSAPVGLLMALITTIYGKFTGRPPSTFVDDIRTNDVIHLVGMLVPVIGIALGFVGSILALIFITPTLSEYIHFVASLFSL
jgi:hypothetical protein